MNFKPCLISFLVAIGTSTTTWAQTSVSKSNEIQLQFGETKATDKAPTIKQPGAKPGLLPKLSYSKIGFSDADQNELLNAMEKTKITITIKNQGKGSASRVLVQASVTNGLKGIEVGKPVQVDAIAPGASRQVEIPLLGTMDLEEGVASIAIEIAEASKPAADKILLDVATQAFLPPQLSFETYSFASVMGKMEYLTPIALQVVIENKGKGIASQVKVDFSLPAHVTETDKLQYKLDKLKPGEKKEIKFSFFVDKQFVGNVVAVKAILSEQYTKYGSEMILPLSLTNEPIAAQLGGQSAEVAQLIITPQTTITAPSGAPGEGVERTSGAASGEFSAEVDRDIPVSRTKNPNRFALIVGNQGYQGYRPELDAPTSVTFARRDAQVFREYCIQTLGIPADQVLYLLDASQQDLSRALDQLNIISKGQAGQAELLFYYAGHGLVGSKSQAPYLVPVDAGRESAKECISLMDVYSKLSEYPSKRITVFLDAGFVAQVNEEKTLPGTKRSASHAPSLKGNLVVLMASAPDQLARPYPQKQHSLFTYYLLSKMQQSKGNLTYDELAKYVSQQVMTKSALLHKTGQEPQVIKSKAASTAWENWTLK